METLEIIHYLKEGDKLIFFLPRHLRAVGAYSLFTHAEKLIQEHNPSALLLDLSGTEYIDSTTIGTFLKLRACMLGRQGAFLLANLHPKVARILSDMHLYDYFSRFSDEALSRVREKVLDSVPMIDKRFLAPWYLKETHECLVKAAPALKESFLPLLRALEAKIALSCNQRAGV
ncbi:STAS domain-containing protein [Spirochaeta thermophila]|uniref:Predicted anti-anti sigma factor n=1 Tax=Winmispira thermophila (strain ATCC 49972 / DSM 6192 / RI 19.B1) TaxID=665571 RepID=E0RNS9_WINT6|nr:STAS domain-containing protein [Spirochaeta thermophila]ADN01202.1 predicted anti-anti sigma factor [Spirochaeta thermophila DSM 6192]